VNANFAALVGELASKQDVADNGDVQVTGTLGLGTRYKVCAAEVAAAPGSVACLCDAGEVAIAGGGWAGAGASLQESRPDSSGGWQITCADAEGAQSKCGGMLILCARISTPDYPY
jgi:hypothetical protein